MPVDISCPTCGNRGELPDGTPSDVTLTCRACGVRFPLWSAVAATVSPLPPDDALAVWVGDPAEQKGRTEWVQQEQAIARDRAMLDARARELDAQQAKLSADLKRQAEELQAELDRRVVAEQENLTRRAEALARSERAMERRREELDATEGPVGRELQAEVERLQGENAALRAEVADLRERAAGQEEMIGRMMAAGQRLIRQRDELRAKVLPADRSPTPPKSAPDRAATHDRLDAAEGTRSRR